MSGKGRSFKNTSRGNFLTGTYVHATSAQIREHMKKSATETKSKVSFINEKVEHSHMRGFYFKR